MANHGDLEKLFVKAWDLLWQDVKGHPEIIGWRETHAHVLLAHHLLNVVAESKDFKLWDNVTFRFDEASGFKIRTSLIPWGFIDNSVRPDIAIATKPGFLEGDDQRGLLVEIKCLRSIRVKDSTTGGLKDRELYNDTNGLAKDLRKIKDYAEVHDGKRYRGVMCILHVHDASFSQPIEHIFQNITWQSADSFSISPYTVRRHLKFIDGDDNETQIANLLK